ncbi:MAG: ion channel [Hyphomonas sp.]
MSDRKGLNRQLFWLYEGHGRAPFVFRWSLLIFDFLTICYFLWAPFETREGLLWVDYAIGVIIALDVAARYYIRRDKNIFWSRLTNWADIIVVVSMFAPLLTENLAFLRILRAVRAVRAFTFIKRAGVAWRFLTRHEMIVDRVTNLAVFLFIMSSVVYVTQVKINPNIHTFLDAFYFTVAALTTTGFGDIVLVGPWGRVLSIVIMVLGLSLFLRLLGAIFRPSDKVEQECESCGLTRHDPDAVHCKHCGATMHIKTGGAT